MFHTALLLVLAGAAIHVFRLSSRSAKSVGETVLRWVLVGYCGLPMIGFMIFGLLRPQELADVTGFPGGSPFQTFAAWALLGMGVTATLGLRLRGAYLVGPAIAWAVFFIGATSIHFQQFSARGDLSHGSMLMIVGTHGLISLVLLVALWMSGVWRAVIQPSGS